MTMSDETCRQMNAELDRRFAGTGDGLSEAGRLHLMSCARCAALYGWISEKQSGLTVNADLTHRIAAQIESSLAPVKPIPSPGAFAVRIAAMFVLLTCALVAFMGGAGITAMSRLQLAGVGALLVSGTTLFSATLGKLTTPGSTRRVPTWLTMLVFATAALGGIALLFPWRAEDASPFLSWQCALRELAIAAPAAVLFWILMRRAVVLSPAAMGAGVGAVAGLLAVSALQFACPHQEALHLLLWHWSVLLVTTAAGALTARCVASIRHI